MKMNKGMHHFQANNEDINKNPEVLFTLTVVEYLCPTNIYRVSGMPAILLGMWIVEVNKVVVSPAPAGFLPYN